MKDSRTSQSTIDPGELIGLYKSEKRIQENIKDNVNIWKCIHGGLRMVKKHKLEFDPRREFWYPVEMLIAIAYLSQNWTNKCAPIEAVRQIAYHVVDLFRKARQQQGLLGPVGEEVVDQEQFAKDKAALSRYTKESSTNHSPIQNAWDSVHEFWPKLPSKFVDHLSEFIDGLELENCWLAMFQDRIPWFPYLGAKSIDEIPDRRRFFFGYANLWTTTNAYVQGGAQVFASILQNTKTSVLLDPVMSWCDGKKSPLETGLKGLGKNDYEIDDETKDWANFSIVNELYGFLNLHRQPIYNKLAMRYKEWFRVESDSYELVSSVGKILSKWLDDNHNAISEFATLYKDLVTNSSVVSRVMFERVKGARAQKKALKKGDPKPDSELLELLDNEAVGFFKGLSDKEAAACAMHLLLDGQLYIASTEQQTIRSSITEPKKETEPSTPDSLLSLPLGLQGPGERALSYLRAGLHVLFAGAPGTGKTTLAQYVGYAWDHNFQELPPSMNRVDAPRTTVGSSAWSPFHTIGGLMPKIEGGFSLHPGIFINESTEHTTDAWMLYNGAVVLDEMNRADLDRCIGELYPLLSGSVECIMPAGLPGIRTIQNSPRFRILATMNDSSLDDIVFPISEGLARRFQRIELPGASENDIHSYLGIDRQDFDQDRTEAAREAIDDFFVVAREHLLPAPVMEVERLPFGVGYFALLKLWIQDSLKLSGILAEATPIEQARDLLVSSLRTLSRQKWESVLKEYESQA